VYRAAMQVVRVELRVFVNRVGHDLAVCPSGCAPGTSGSCAFKDVALECSGATASQAAVDAFKTEAGIGLQDRAGC
jgi:hypothetical protein